MSACIEQHSYKNNQFSKYCENFDRSSQFPTLDSYKLRLTKKINMWMNRSRQRKVLAKLDNRMLDDIGITYSQAKKEFSEPFWR